MRAIMGLVVVGLGVFAAGIFVGRRGAEGPSTLAVRPAPAGEGGDVPSPTPQSHEAKRVPVDSPTGAAPLKSAVEPDRAGESAQPSSGAATPPAPPALAGAKEAPAAESPKTESPKTAPTKPAPTAQETAAKEAPAKTTPASHPFAPAIARAKTALGQIEKIRDYTALLTKRERIGGTLLDYEYIYLKVRQEPFSAYLRFVAPESLAGREVIYVAGQNNGKMLAHEAAGKGDFLSRTGRLFGVGVATLDPAGLIAMRGNRYPVTDIGILNLTRRLIEVGEADMQHGEATAKTYPRAKVNDRPCEAWVFTHPVKRDHFRFHRAEIFIDQEHQVPIRYASYEWPAEPNGAPVLLEEYTYSKVKFNVGLKDVDFDVANPKYKFPQ